MAARRKYFYEDFIPIPGDSKRRYVSPSSGEVLSRYEFESLARGESYYKVRLRNKYLGAPPPVPAPANKKVRTGAKRKKAYTKADYDRRFKAAQITWWNKLNDERSAQGEDALPFAQEVFEDYGFLEAYDKFKHAGIGSPDYYDAIDDLDFDEEIDYFPDGDTP